MKDYFRPISLCSVLYKIISKCLANRLKVWMDDLISENQSAFQGKFSNGKKMALKLYMSKAFDRVEWKFLEAVMVKMGFAEAWILKIMNCSSSVSFSFLLNGDMKGNITPGVLSQYLSHLLFADDNFIFMDANTDDARVLCDILKSYGDALGQLG
ncbi:hypothetical protein UlMin_018176 [Ulmus minor]